MNRRRVALLVALLALAAPSSAQAIDIVVTTTADDDAPVPAGSLRAAINQANMTLALDRIVFAIPGDGVHTITPEAPFNNLTTKIDVDATTQPGYAGTPLIELNGENMPADENGFLIQSSGTAVRGLAINRYAGGAGVFISGEYADTVIERNHLGTDPSGTVARPNKWGIRISAGDDAVIDGNVISGNTEQGVLIAAISDGNTLTNNRIGTDRSGTAALGNAKHGVFFNSSAPNVVGPGNVIAANAQDGVRIGDDAHGSRVKGSRIGIGPGGEALGNNGDGVNIQNSDSNVIGGEAPGDGNLIAYNAFTGVRGVSSQNTVLGNGIHSHGDLGIDMAVGGPTPNDDGADAGVTNHPELTSVENAAGGVRVRGTLQTDPNEEHRVELFSSPGCDLSGHGEGARFLGSVDVTTNAEGTGEFDALMPGPVMRFDAAEIFVPEGTNGILTASVDRAQEPVFTATATDSSLYTSEFSPCATLSGVPSAQPRTVLSGSARAEDLMPGFAFGPLTFDALSRATELATAQDTLFEGPETVSVELADPAGGSVGTPASVLVTIVDDDPPPLGDPQFPPANAQPDSSIDRIPRRIKASRLRRFRGRATDDGGIARIELAVIRLAGGAKAAAVRKRCGRLRASGRLRRVKPRAGRCRPAFVLRATGTTRWTYRLKRKLRKGRYVVFSRAVDAAGVAERSFTAGDGNRRAFRVV